MMKSSKYTQVNNDSPSSKNDNNDYHDYQNTSHVQLTPNNTTATTNPHQAQQPANNNNDGNPRMITIEQASPPLQQQQICNRSTTDQMLRNQPKQHHHHHRPEQQQFVNVLAPEIINAHDHHHQITDNNIEMMMVQCNNCAIRDAPPPPSKTTRFSEHHRPHQHYAINDNVLLNRSCNSLSQLETNANVTAATATGQFSLDRSGNKCGGGVSNQHGGYMVCDKNKLAPPPPRIVQLFDRNASLKRVQSPEIINIHRGPNNVLYDGYGGADNCAIKSCPYDGDFISNCDEYGFKRGPRYNKVSGSR